MRCPALRSADSLDKAADEGTAAARIEYESPSSLAVESRWVIRPGRYCQGGVWVLRLEQLRILALRATMRIPVARIRGRRHWRMQVAARALAR